MGTGEQDGSSERLGMAETLFFLGEGMSRARLASLQTAALRTVLGARRSWVVWAAEGPGGSWVPG